MKALILEEGKAPEWWLAEDWYAKYFELQATGDQELVDQPWKPIEDFRSQMPHIVMTAIT